MTAESLFSPRVLCRRGNQSYWLRRCASFDPVGNFWRRVQKTEAGCWNWTGLKNEDGYGVIGVAGRVLRTHRFSWILHYGDIPKGLQVLHRCDNPGCVNPAHLFLGTPADNYADMRAKGRQKHPGQPRGERHAMAILSDQQTEEIRRRYEPKYGCQTRLAREFGVSNSTIWKIVHQPTPKPIGKEQLCQ